MTAQHLGRGLALAMAGLLSAACAGQDAPTGIEGPQYSSGSSPDLAHIAQYQEGAPQITIAWAMAWIGPAGGTLRLLDFEVIVPPGAVSTRTRFSIRLPVDPHARTHALAEFQPHNVTFAQPVTLRLPYEGTTAEDTDARVMWWSGAAWVPFATEVVDGRLETTTTHFSTYGTEDTSRGITPLGG
jgi:hypothetical protein